eukprot:GHVT01068162.1.p1 GENE.GHVT01068162.1~~GHVT01068162.1.p1  ORF type:complete len:304 (-),score=31.30 GHVT01068162.1:604-1515(-)
MMLKMQRCCVLAGFPLQFAWVFAFWPEVMLIVGRSVVCPCLDQRRTWQAVFAVFLLKELLFRCVLVMRSLRLALFLVFLLPLFCWDEPNNWLAGCRCPHSSSWPSCVVHGPTSNARSWSFGCPFIFAVASSDIKFKEQALNKSLVSMAAAYNAQLMDHKANLAEEENLFLLDENARLRKKFISFSSVLGCLAVGLSVACTIAIGSKHASKRRSKKSEDQAMRHVREQAFKQPTNALKPIHLQACDVQEQSAKRWERGKAKNTLEQSRPQEHPKTGVKMDTSKDALKQKQHVVFKSNKKPQKKS